MPFWGSGVHMDWMGLWWIVSVAVLALLVWFLVMAPRNMFPRSEEDSPEAVLKRRYARGEIEREEYERRLQSLRA